MHEFSGSRCLVVGGGKVALKRAKRVISAGGIVDVVTLECLPELEQIIIKGGGSLKTKAFSSEDVNSGYSLAVASTNDVEVNKSVAQVCKNRGVLVNVADNSSLCDVVFPTVVDRDPAIIAIASGSASPQFSMLIKNRINMFIPSGYGRLAKLFGKYRKQVNTTLIEPAARRQFWNKVVHGYVAESALSGNYDIAEAHLKSALQQPESFSAGGEVYLIGAGPGDPDLLTMRAFRLLQQSEIIIYDRLVSQEILDRLEDGKELIYVGKQRSDHSVPQQQINQLLVEYAKKGKRVSRLKGGDPFIFGRGGEEIEQLAEQSIPFQVIPGISAANGCASYTGIPLTHRDHAQSVRFVTGQLQNGTVNLDWQSLTAPDQTLVFYMGLQGLPVICENLIKHGCPPDTLAAVIEKGTTLDQKVYTSTVKNLPQVIIDNNVQAPTLTIIGSVVGLHDKLNWFGK